MHPARTYIIVSSIHIFAIGLIATGYVPFLLDLGLSASDIPLINVFFQGTIFLLEIPTGLLADSRSRGWSVKVGIGLWVLSVFTYSLVQGFWSAIVAEALGGIGNAFISGAFSAWLADSLKKREEYHLFAKVQATTLMVQAICMLVSGFVGSFIFNVSPRLGFCVSGVLAGVAWIWSLRTVDDSGEPPERVSEIKALKMTVQGLRSRPALRWGAAASAAIGVVFLFNFFWSPFYRRCFGGDRIGYVWIALYSSMALAGFLLRYGILKFKRQTTGMVVGLVLSGVGLAACGIVGCTVGSLAFIGIHEFGRGLFRPLAEPFFQDQFESANRATAGSAQSFIQTAAYTVILLVSWFTLRGLPPSNHVIASAWAIGGLILTSCSLLLWVYRPYRRASLDAKAVGG